MVRRTDWPLPPPDDGRPPFGGGPEDGAAPPGGRRRGGRGPAAYGEGDGPDGARPEDGEYGPEEDPDGSGGPGQPGRSGRGGASRRRSRGRREPSEDRVRETSLSPEERARAICLRLLTGSPRTRKQLADALAKRDVDAEVAEAVLDRLEAAGLIDDAAFAGAWVESRHHGRGLARRALARELRTRGVAAPVVDEAVGRLDADTEEETARELVARKLRATRGLDRDKRVRRLAGMLARRGYGEGLAIRVVREALEAEGEEAEDLLAD
ncbi:recombination regulator RecX [Streptomyces sp. WAC 06738]|uniref:recombination regulator RecX n=1 Tax=Streptomyces sp. WAC 06738 TaxID=2203210 RepID=UPI000F6D0489|nr:recombination regulator RecX [Streptomyces sp. WAC 06738]AZM49139.1 recombination regulator RecX [Streptomyces sp. WAC 06738]